MKDVHELYKKYFCLRLKALVVSQYISCQKNHKYKRNFIRSTPELQSQIQRVFAGDKLSWAKECGIVLCLKLEMAERKIYFE